MHRQQAFGFAAAATCIQFLGTSSAMADKADGTIHFVGAIVVAPYSVSRNVATAPASVGLTQVRGSQGRVVLTREDIARPSASLHVHSTDPDAVEMSFTGTAGQSDAVPHRTFHPIGRDGGELLIRHRGPQKRSLALVTVGYD